MDDSLLFSLSSTQKSSDGNKNPYNKLLLRLVEHPLNENNNKLCAYRNQEVLYTCTYIIYIYAATELCRDCAVLPTRTSMFYQQPTVYYIGIPYTRASRLPLLRFSVSFSFIYFSKAASIFNIIIYLYILLETHYASALCTTLYNIILLNRSCI